MAAINIDFGKKLSEFGAFDFNACYNCGTCTAVCSLSTEEDSFPREMLRFSVLGMEDDIKSSLKPWLCYYCGQCSTYCPQEANPAELMMSLRRWLTSAYDWTKLSGLLYRSLTATITAMVILALGVVAFAISEKFDLGRIMHTGHLFEMIAIGSVFLIILLPNIIRMWWLIILKPGIRVPLIKYVSSFWDLILHMFTQKRALDCDDNRFRWFEHFILVIGYLGLLFTTVFLDWFASESLFVIVLGYVVSIIIFIITIDFVYDRIKKTKEISKYSQPSDWMFVVWLFLMGISAFGVRLFIDLGIMERNIWLYLVHMIILVQWALIIVPFGKWTHFLYRSFAMYFQKVKES
ncbi:MAG TPA: 4Fe-4S dicluster domain-containing protein [Bacteroidales bacterium]|nr:4Fe-4S dicluster domain-containing protein [Bacteroidales bacterium]HPF02770.1 4Fe-4S dicluster domain-containing protein [Bacteroidales bacterium]HPJ58914.1 4Fe-4S dicluster domain-containing protein [Bacteroidales bacterium]HPR12168.1 4Fe-4S dicluster domain-containing protein [Bacteroidales bacterium]HRW84851.1 4Fe-4S dicluster domain-containing protein [Bacteroidales bacterium]